MNLFLAASVVSTLAFFSFGAIAQGRLPDSLSPEYTGQLYESNIRTCSAKAGTANAVMKARQKGISMADLYGIIVGIYGENDFESKEDEKDFVETISRAYEVPIFQFEDMRVEAVNKFERDYFVKCVENVNSMYRGNSGSGKAN